MYYRWLVLFFFAILPRSIMAEGPVIYYGAHLTNLSPWCCRLTVYNMSATSKDFRLKVYDMAGNLTFEHEYTTTGSLVIVFPTADGVPPQQGEEVVTAVEGIFIVETDSPYVKPKIAYRFGKSESLCEFLLPDSLAHEYFLPASPQPFFNWAGVAVMNPYPFAIDVRLTCHLPNGQQLSTSTEARIPGHSKYVRLAEGIWPPVSYGLFDQIRIETADWPIPPPMFIAGNQAQSRHVFFNAGVRPHSLYRDATLGYQRRIGRGFFQQGSSSFENCKQADEMIWPTGDPCSYPVLHELTNSFYMMETEVTRDMWNKVRDRFPSLVADPSFYSDSVDHPVENVSWFEAVLFANLVSEMSGLYPCYFADAGLATPLSPGNYLNGSVYFDPAADGWRLPGEGEWEYACRAGTTGLFSVVEPAWHGCGDCGSSLPELMKVAVYCGMNYQRPAPVASLAPNPWGLFDMHGNISEWCQDWYAPYPTGPVTDYRGPATSGTWTSKVHRGGNFQWDPYFMRSAKRGDHAPGNRAPYLGFRLVRTAMD